DAAAASHAAALAAMAARRALLRQSLAALDAVRLADLVRRLALGALGFLAGLLALQIPLDLLRREVTLVDVLGEIDLDELEEPALILGDRALGILELGIDVGRGVESFRRLARRQVVERSGEGEQVAARFGLADDLLGRSITFGINARLG